MDEETYLATMQAMVQDRQFAHASQRELRERIDALVRTTIDSVENNMIADAKDSIESLAKRERAVSEKNDNDRWSACSGGGNCGNSAERM